MNLRKGNVSVLPNVLNSWKCEACDRMLLSKAVYINHNKIHAVGRGSREAEAEVKQVCLPYVWQVVQVKCRPEELPLGP